MGAILAFSLLPTNLLFCIIALSLQSSTADVLGNETDRLALIAFKDGITQDPLLAMSSWNSSIHFCTWKGVTCSNRHQRVIRLNLESEGLVGSVSPYIGNLSFLTSINLQNNSLQGKIPEQVGRLFRLQELWLNNNSLSDKIPVNLSYCTNLLNITLAYNELVGKIPVEFGSLLKLVRLSLYANSLTGSIPASIGNLSYLDFLVLGRNNLVGSIPDSFGRLSKLTFFSLGQNMLSGKVPPQIYNISSLTTISLPFNQLEGSLPHGSGLNLPNLRSFTIGGNNFSGTIPASFITNASRLQLLTLSFNKFSGKVPTELGTLKGLQSLLLDANNLGDGKAGDLDFVTSLNNCSTLNVLSITRNRFGGILPGSIPNLSTTVSELYVGANQISGTIPAEIVNLKNLVILSLEMNLITGVIPEGIGVLQKLQVLSLWDNRFSGQIPNSIQNMSQLYYLDLSDNNLQGNISSLEKCRSLQILNLSYNHIKGTIPQTLLLGLSGRLTTIILASNSLVGPLPSEVGNLISLQRLDIADNKISGQIPSSLGSCLRLEHLHLQGNFLQGIIPSTFSSLKGLQQLDLSRNKLSGKIPDDLEELSSLGYLNLSFNEFEGEVPRNGIFQNASAFSIAGNDKLCGGIPKLDLLGCQVKKSKGRGISLAMKVTLGVVIPVITLASLLFVVYLTKKHKTKSKQTLGLTELSMHPLKTVSYSDLWNATNGFSPDNLIGTGSCGSVYKGILQNEETPIAVKVLNLIDQGAYKSFMAECEVLRNVRHRNLLKIITVCSSLDFKGHDFKALVFEFMSNGSVENWLHPCSNRKNLWRNLNLFQRLNIAIDVASALDYLHNHCGTPIVHCDLKPSNILLDNDMVAYVGDFGLAKFLPQTNTNFNLNDTNSAGMRGTIGYIPPEYGMGAEVSTQGDMFSYGILLLEMFTGKRPTDKMFKDGLDLHHFSKSALTGQVMDIIDPLLLNEVTSGTAKIDHEENSYMMDQMHECLISMIKIGVACSSGPIVERMEISDALLEMHTIQALYFH